MFSSQLATPTKVFSQEIKAAENETVNVFIYLDSIREGEKESVYIRRIAKVAAVCGGPSKATQK